MSSGLKFCIAGRQSDDRGSLTHKAVITRITKGRGYMYTYVYTYIYIHTYIYES